MQVQDRVGDRGRTAAAVRRAGAGWLGACLVALLSTGLAAVAADADPSRRYRGLDEGERARALAHARSRADVELSLRAGRSPGAAFRSEVLLVERHRGGKDPALASRRLADVYVYDYEADQLSRSVVDLDRDVVESVAVVEGAQLPLTEREVERALALVFADDELAERIRADYHRVTGSELADPSQLRVSGFVFRADSMPGARSRAAAVCGRHRCAQLLLRTREEVALQLPVVDLSRRRVLDSHAFAVNRAEREARRRAGPAPAPHAPRAHDHSGHGHDHAH